MLTREQPSEDNVRGITAGLILCDVSKREYIETRMTRDNRVDAGEGHEDDPGHKPDRQEDFAHHAKEANEEVGVHAVDGLDGLEVFFENREGPC
jgi:hypothetical protein